MIITFEHHKKRYKADLSKPLDISIPLGQAKCFYAPDLKMTPYESDGFIGSVKAGAPVNFYNVQLNPHGNGTHTECVGHITLQQESVNQCIKQYHSIAQLITVTPVKLANGDQVISQESLSSLALTSEAIVIRTTPNNNSKLTNDYSHTNPPYFENAALAYLRKQGIKHLLTDLPSVDREHDEGKLQGHKTFWLYPTQERLDCSITELIYVPNEILDGLYLLNLQFPPLELDAAPSRPVLYCTELI